MLFPSVEDVTANISRAKVSMSRSAIAARIFAVSRSLGVVVGEWKFIVSESTAPKRSPARFSGIGIWFSRKIVATIVAVEPTISLGDATGKTLAKAPILWWSMTSRTRAFSIARTDWANSLWSTMMICLFFAFMMWYLDTYPTRCLSWSTTGYTW